MNSPRKKQRDCPSVNRRNLELVSELELLRETQMTMILVAEEDKAIHNQRQTLLSEFCAR
jgi:hypothetical protein